MRLSRPWIRECVAMKELRTAHIRSEDNPADLATKVISRGPKRDKLVAMILYDIADNTYLK